MPALEKSLCDHCFIPVGGTAYRGHVAGQDYIFCCFGCYIAFHVHGERGEEAQATLFLIRLGVGAFLAMNIMVLSLLLYLGAVPPDQLALRRGIEVILWMLATPAVAILGLPVMRDAWRGARQGRIVTEAMISVGGMSAYLYSVASLLRGENRVYFDTATMLFLLFTVGRYLEAAARARAVRDLAPLLEAEKASARVITASGETTRPAAAVAIGDHVRVGPGERLPVDGEVIEGNSEVDQSLVTGEARPVAKAPGDPVLAGTTNGDGQLLLRTLASGAATHWAEIGRAVREALARRSRLQNMTDRISTYFLPCVLLVAVGSGLYWSQRRTTWEALSATLATLVVACPCALGPAAYLASFLGIGMAARRGTLIRSTRALEDLAAVRCVAFDKTGSLTRGTPALVAFASSLADDRELLRAAAELAARDEHPLSRAIAGAARDRGMAVEPVAVVETRRGKGLIGGVVEDRVALGSAALFGDLGWQLPAPLAAKAVEFEAGGYSVAFIGRNGNVRGVAAFEDETKPEAFAVLAEIRRRGLTTAILSGDGPQAVARLARALGVDRWEAALSPQEKLVAVRRLMVAEGGVAMVGDGLNDGPVLAGATAGIALGSGSELARMSADIVTAGADLTVVPWLIDLARMTRRTTRINLGWAFGYNFVGLCVATAGLLQPVIAASLMACSSILVVTNSLRMTRGRLSRSSNLESTEATLAESRNLGVAVS